MVLLDQYKYDLQQYAPQMKDLEGALGREEKNARIAQIEEQKNDPDFWTDGEKSGGLMKEMKALKEELNSFDKVKTQYDDLLTLIDMAIEENDGDLEAEIESEFASFVKNIDSYKVATLLSGEFDHMDAILTLHAGAGGTESCDWAGMLYRMYTRWAERHKYSIEVLDYLDGDEAGIKSVTVQISGLNAYG